MNEHRKVVSLIGRKTLAGALGVRIAAVGNSVSAGVFASSWYPTVYLLAAEKGVFVPLSMFSFRVPEDAQCLDAQSKQLLSERS